jgi:hypothetical protein
MTLIKNISVVSWKNYNFILQTIVIYGAIIAYNITYEGDILIVGKLKY